MQISDSVVMDASGLTRTKDGYLVGDAKVARAGNVQYYLGSELGLTGADADKTFGVYRDPDEVFNSASMMSLAGRPVTRNHPENGVTADNWKELAKGQVGGVIRKDGEFVIAPMAIMDAAAAAEVESGARSLSAGYTCDLIKESGEVDGVPYQFKQSNIKFNHVAYLPDNNPRAGNTRIGDNNPGGKPKHPSKQEDIMSDALKTVVLGDAAVQVAIADVAAIEAFKAAMTQKLADAESDKASVVAAKDAEIARKDAEIDALKAKVLDDAAIDKLVQERADLIATAKAIADQDYTGKSAAEIRKAAVVAKLGDAAIKDKSPEYIAARFDILAEDAAKEPHRQVVAPSAAQAGTAKAMADSYNNYVADLNAWRNKEAK